VFSAHLTGRFWVPAVIRSFPQARIRVRLEPRAPTRRVPESGPVPQRPASRTNTELNHGSAFRNTINSPGSFLSPTRSQARSRPINSCNRLRLRSHVSLVSVPPEIASSEARAASSRRLVFQLKRSRLFLIMCVATTSVFPLPNLILQSLGKPSLLSAASQCYSKKPNSETQG